MNEEKKSYYEQQIKLASQMLEISNYLVWKDLLRQIESDKKELLHKLINANNISVQRLYAIRGQLKTWGKLDKLISSYHKNGSAARDALQQGE